MRFVCVVSLETFAKDQSGGESMRCKAKSTEGKDPFRLRQSGRRPLRAYAERARLAESLAVAQKADAKHVQQLAAVRAAVSVPVIASGGAGDYSHFADLFRDTNIDGALAAMVPCEERGHEPPAGRS